MPSDVIRDVLEGVLLVMGQVGGGRGVCQQRAMQCSYNL
jgi:hypothetical protein